ncbi:MAG: CoA-acylating methylmalonate-semialdehyde dehydrogenase [Polyangiaceae bacterium]|nr:CoA-acylating methylmalonate-semialdehyde dehydrogenase [Polyangiaceae bacterium]
MTQSQTLPAFPARSYDFVEYVPAKNWIDGQWVDAASGQTIPVENPRHGKALSKVVLSGAEDVDRAAKAAKKAFESWRRVPIKERAQVFFKLKELMERDLEELSWLVTHENGKIIEEARASVLKGIECVEFGASLPNAAAGERLEVSRGVTCTQDHEPLGVVAGITPFNFPIMVPLWMMPQAIVGGNAFILKPSEQVPLGSLKLAQLLEEAGLPKGVFNVVHGGVDAVNALCDHEDIQAMAFVGSTKVARLVYARGAAAGKSMLCLGGAKNHLIVVPDADVKLTAENVVASFTGCAGQRCMAASVLVAVGEVDHVIDAIKKRASELTVGKELGPVINKASEERMGRYVDEAEKQGAKVLVDGRGKRGAPEGYWFAPTVLDGVTEDMPAWKDEIFGPVLSIVRVKTVDEAIALENRCPYGNASSVYTTSGAVAEYVTGRVEAGMVGVNIGVPVPREPFGFGGWNHSKFGHGNITGMDGYRFWTRPRKITSKWELQQDSNWMS